MAAAIAPLWSTGRVATALGVSLNDLMEMRRRGSLLGVETSDGDFFYPLAQFQKNADGSVQVRPRLQEYFAILRDHDSWSVALCAGAPADELGGLSPLEWVRSGGSVETLKEYADVLDAEWSR